MKLCILGPASPFRGGISQFLHNMSDALIENNVVSNDSLTIITYKKQYPNLFFPGKTQYDNSQKSYNYPIIRLLTPHNPLTWKKTAKYIVKLNPEVVIIKFWIPLFCPAYTYMIDYIKKYSNIKISILCHNFHFHEKWFLSKFLTYRMIKNADSLIVLSENVYPKNLNKKIIKLFHPIYPIENPIVKKNKDNIVLFLGYIKPYKGLDVLINSIPIVNKNISNIKFVIAGEVYGKKPLIPENINNIEVNYNYINQNDIYDYFQNASLVVVPYKTATQSGIIQLAYSFLKPVIASDIPGLKEMVQVNKTGLLFESENSSDLANKIIEFFNNYDENKYRENISDYNLNFTWKAFVEALKGEL